MEGQTQGRGTGRVPPAVPEEVLAGAGRVLVLGDTHRVVPAVERGLDLAAAAGIRVVLSVGDFGIDAGRFTKRVDLMLAERDQYLLVTPGNHEDYERLEAAPRDAAGMPVLGQRLRALPRGYRWDMGGRAFGSLGGATSVHTWMGAWHPEHIRHEDVARLLGSPRNRTGEADISRTTLPPLDVLITHEVPERVPVVSGLSGIPRPSRDEAARGRRLLRRAVEVARPRAVLSGPWHQRVAHVETWPDGSTTRFEVLPHEHHPWNAAALNLATLRLQDAQGSTNAGPRGDR